MIQRKRILAATLVAALGLTAAACGDDEETTDTTAAAATDTTMADDTGTTMADEPSEDASTVGLLFDLTGRGDKSFNDSAAAGLDRAAADLGIDPAESAPTGDDDRVPRLNLFVDEGRDLIVGVGFLWDGAVAAGAAANPDTHFAIVDSVITSFNNATPDDETDDVELTNVASLVFAANEGSFLVGAAAALTSETGKIGFVGGVDFPLIHEFEAGYIAGAKSVNPDVEILSQYASVPPDFTGFTDTAKGKEIASQMYADGADVVYHAAGQTGNGVFEAASEAGEPGSVWAIGVDSDQYETAAEAVKPYILTSMLKRVDVAVYETIKAESEGTFTAGVQVFDLAADGVGYATTGDFLSAETIAALEALKAQIIDGTITVPTDPDAA
ncbi:MAG TPA: BMP family ABC transporter substrate-binding protein [Ilumatobacter sp.]|nr:BMP family ABC transporter substrate-binding protein [Ilumatobacter sp.]